MSSDCGQLGRAMDEDVSLFPYPNELSNDHFSMNQVFPNGKASSCLQVEFQLISPVEFRVQTSRVSSDFINGVLMSHKNLKYHKNPKFQNVYDLNLKHYIYVISKVKYLQREGFMTLNYNHFDTDFIYILMKNLSQNDNILTFIQNRKSQKSIIESLEFDPKFGKSMKMMSEKNMFDEDFDESQKIAFYMAVVRNGKAILADKDEKSILTALTIMTYFREDWPLVIVCDRRRKRYWKYEVKYKCVNMFVITLINEVADIYVYPNAFHDIMIMDYDLYYDIKDTVSFRNLNIKAFIFEDQTRGHHSSKQWKGLSECVDNLQNANRIIFISANPFDSDNCKRWWPLLRILDLKAFQDYDKFDSRYCDPDHEFRDQMIKEFQILLRLTFLICDQTFD